MGATAQPRSAFVVRASRNSEEELSIVNTMRFRAGLARNFKTPGSGDHERFSLACRMRVGAIALTYRNYTKVRFLSRSV